MVTYEGGAWNGLDNEVLQTALTYIVSAETLSEREDTKTAFLSTKHWFVVHHLSVIAVELLLKAIGAEITLTDPHEIGDLPSFQVTAPLKGHSYSISRELARRSSPQHTLYALQHRLDAAQWRMLRSMEVREFAMSELTKGRYPHEGERPGRVEAMEWLSIANEIAEFLAPEWKNERDTFY